MIRKNNTIKLALPLALALLLAIGLSACGLAAGTETTVINSGGQKKFEAEFIDLFDTLTQMVGYADNKDDFSVVANAVRDDLKIYHQLYDIYHSYPGVTNLRDINEQAGQGPVVVDPKIIKLLKYGQEIHTLTGSRVNIAMGSVLRIWHDYREQGMENPESAAVPDREELEAAARHTDIRDMIIDETHSTVELRDPEMSLDVGAIAKGFAAEMAAQAAMARGVGHLLLSVGGNVRAIGFRNQLNELWRAGIENPDTAASEYLAIVSIHDLSVVTSGVYERYYEVNGIRYHHIIDPETLFPGNRFLSVTILTEDSGLADALSTALFNMSYEDGLTLIASLEDTYALWCFPDGSLKESPGFSAFIQ